MVVVRVPPPTITINHCHCGLEDMGLTKIIPKLNKKMIRMVATPKTMRFPPAHKEFMALLNSNLEEMSPSIQAKSDAVDRALASAHADNTQLQKSSILYHLNKHSRASKNK